MVNGSPVKASTHKDKTFCLTSCPSFKKPMNFHISFPLNVFKPKLSRCSDMCRVVSVVDRMGKIFISRKGLEENCSHDLVLLTYLAVCLLSHCVTFLHNKSLRLSQFFKLPTEKACH